MLAPKEFGERLYLQLGACAVYQRLIDLVHIAASFESKVAAVFELVDRIRIAKPGLLLLVERQPEAKTRGIYPAVTHVVKSPYRIIRRQGICDFIQSIRVGAAGETVVLLFKLDASPFGFSLHPFVAVENNLSSKWRMAAHL